tara:strand:- start:66 stop:533 length:468 start_codon:yes stop_codon:yes gene_type:complete
MTTQKITPKYIDQVRNKLQSIINKEKLNLDIKFGNATYDDDTFTIKLKVSLPNALSEEEKALAHEIKVRQANKSWMKPLDTTKVAEIITSQGKRKYTLCGFKPRARKNPFIVLNLIDNKQYLMSEERAEMLFADPKWKNDIKAKNFTPTFRHEVK